MNYFCVSISLLSALALATGVQASTLAPGGIIHFRGAITQPAYVPMTTSTTTQVRLAEATVTLPLSKARTMLSSDVLNYFATYAPADAKLVSATYR